MGRLLALIGMAAAALVFGIAAHGITNGWKQARLERAVEANAEQIFRSPSSIVAGNPAGDVSVVVFYDANCPYCREGAPALAKLIANDGQVRLVLKQLPVLGPDSEAVARVMLAAARQGKAFELYQRLLAAPAPATKDKAMRIAGELGLDPARLEQDAQDPAITETLAGTKSLAETIGVPGVPYYLVGDRVLGEGVQDLYGELTTKVAEIRKDGCSAAC
ncbi:MAG: DsbA family protein [Methyloceanibacter sp.]